VFLGDSVWEQIREQFSKEQPTDRKLILKWVAPIAVCAGLGDDIIIPTVHPVLEDTGAPAST